MCGVDPVISKSSHGINEKTYSSIYTKKGNSNKFAIPKIKNYRIYIETFYKTYNNKYIQRNMRQQNITTIKFILSFSILCHVVNDFASRTVLVSIMDEE